MGTITTKATLAAVFLLYISAAPAQLQLALTGGAIPLPTALIKGVLLALVIVGGSLTSKDPHHKHITRLALVLAAYLVADAVLLFSTQEVSAMELLIVGNTYYVPLLLAPLVVTIRPQTSEEVTLRVTVLLLLICGGIGLAQYFLQLPLLYTESTDGRFAVYSWDFASGVRAFSLFGSALEFSTFPVLGAGIGIAMAASSSTIKRSIILIPFSALVCYTTLTRVAYVQFIFACVTAIIIVFTQRPRFVRWLPFIYCFLSPIAVFYGAVLAGENSGLQSTESLGQRLTGWSYYIDQLQDASLFKIFVGQGIGQNSLLDSGLPFIDNTHLAVVLASGVLGWIVMLLLFAAMWKVIIKRAIATKTPLAVGVASVWSAFTAVWWFNIQITVYAVLFMLLFLSTSAAVADDKGSMLEAKRELRGAHCVR
jgi:hypothetical protein